MRKKIHSFFITSILLLSLNSSYICENSKLDFVMRNNINGDFSIVKKISELKPGAFININWNKKKLMLPYSLRKDYISFTDKKWDWRYQYNEDGSPNINNPSLYELLPSGEIKIHFCETDDNKANL
ncbi:hypothetical protein [uncultured Prochlorococcus sp.]|uniref:hypothetical protein n=1 Tax=uncultured Prochlorococcus sp. TaxID=159733 RepID=UPI00258C87E8|nr:hypothetical protein [uncultured Prochlorococcus sp.]